MLNKVMWEVDKTDDNLRSFKADPVRFLDQWEAAWESPEPPFPPGGTLEPEERRSLESLDFGALYAMGANPYILWQFARAVSVPERAGIEELTISFRNQVAPHGYPDFAT